MSSNKNVFVTTLDQIDLREVVKYIVERIRIKFYIDEYSFIYFSRNLKL